MGYLSKLRAHLVVGFLCAGALFANEPVPLLSIGGGNWFAGPHHSGGVVQVDYRWNYAFFHFRPQAVLLFPEFQSFYAGFGIAWEINLPAHFVLTPSFCPGLYYQGEGRNLGCPLEFRSSMELAYEFSNRMRVGTQFYHLSNASIGDHNPGANAWVFIVSTPFGGRF